MISPNSIFGSFQKNKYLELLPSFKEEKTQKFTTIVLTLVAMSFFGFFALSPTLSTIAGLQKKLEDGKFINQQLDKKINDLSVLQQKYNALQPDLPYVFASIPQKPEAPLFVAELQALMKQSSLTLDSMQTFEVEADNTSSTKKYYSFAFNLSAEGAYQDISNFLNSTVQMQRIISLDLISISKKSETNNLEVNLKGNTYFKP